MSSIFLNNPTVASANFYKFVTIIVVLRHLGLEKLDDQQLLLISPWQILGSGTDSAHLHHKSTVIIEINDAMYLAH